MRKTTVLISGMDLPACDSVRGMLDGQPDLELNSRIADPAQADPLFGQATLPDILIVVLGARWEETLRALAMRPAQQRPPVIAVSQTADSQIMRRAMQAGARDFFSLPVPHTELLEALRRIARDKGMAEPAGPKGSLIAVINAKGGSGASFIAANLAHILATRRKTPVALVDLDLQFGTLPLALDLEQRNSLLEALNVADQLDALALEGYVAKHASGVQVLSAMSDQLPLPWEIPAKALARLINVAREAYGAVVVDLPRQIDPLTSQVLSMADHVLMVMQQSLAHVRDAKRMLRVVTGSLSVPRDNMLFVVNRHSDKNPVQLKDIQDTIVPPALALVPNDFQAVSESLNIGEPLLAFDRNLPVTRALLELAARIDPSIGEEPGARPAPRMFRFRQAVTGSLKF